MAARCPPFTLTKVFHQRAFPFFGKQALALGAYLGILVHHSILTSNTTNQGTELWKSLSRLAISGLVVYFFVWQLRFVDQSNSIYLLYLNKTFVPCGGAAFLLCSFLEPLFEHLKLLQRDYSRKYCVFIHDDPPAKDFSRDKAESLLPMAVRQKLPPK